MPQILIVDDDSKFSQRICELLTRSGYTALVASDGIQALKLIGEFKDTLSLVIMDLSLPKTSGFEVIGVVTQRAPNIKILATSAVYKEPYLQSALEIGAHQAIPKPATDSEWLAIIQKMLALRAGS
jgi:two-component system response regulator CpxR